MSTQTEPARFTEQEIALKGITPIDGRYHKDVWPLEDVFSEYALMRFRVMVEVLYLVALSKFLKKFHFSSVQETWLYDLYQKFSIEDAKCIKDIEKETNHDVKAIEYFIKEKMKEKGFDEMAIAHVHFGLTSADVDNIARSFMLIRAVVLLQNQLGNIKAKLKEIASANAHAPMLARTHGQPASPTTFGKEIKVFETRLNFQLEKLGKQNLFAKLGGATGNMNAHYAAYPDKDWRGFACNFVENFAGLTYVSCTTQIEAYDSHAELFQTFVRINNILIGFVRDIWHYVSDNWIVQIPKAGEVGSSAMPHKINPIRFENAEGNLEMANALFEFFAGNLTISRLQRDLTDSTVVRNLGIPIAHSMIAYNSILGGLARIKPNTALMQKVTAENWGVLAEPIQSILRSYGVVDAYEILKDLTRGNEVTGESLHYFIEKLIIPGLEVNEHADLKVRLLNLRPEQYIGDASRLAEAE